MSGFMCLRGGLMTSILVTFPRRPALALPGLGGVGVGRDAHCSHFPFKPPGPTCDRCWAGRGWGVGGGGLSGTPLAPSQSEGLAAWRV